MLCAGSMEYGFIEISKLVYGLKTILVILIVILSVNVFKKKSNKTDYIKANVCKCSKFLKQEKERRTTETTQQKENLTVESTDNITSKEKLSLALDLQIKWGTKVLYFYTFFFRKKLCKKFLFHKSNFKLNIL